MKHSLGTINYYYDHCSRALIASAGPTAHTATVTLGKTKKGPRALFFYFLDMVDEIEENKKVKTTM